MMIQLKMYMIQKENEGKAKKVAKIATLNKFLRQYYGKVKRKYKELEMYPFSALGKLEAETSADANLNIRPVLNLRADVEFTGAGTMSNPYVIK